MAEIHSIINTYGGEWLVYGTLAGLVLGGIFGTICYAKWGE